MVAVSQDEVSRIAGCRIAGMLGYTYLEHFKISYSYRNRVFPIH